MTTTETRISTAQFRIWPPPEERLQIACKHWTAEPDHLGRGACSLGLFAGTPVLGHCLLKCDQYTGTKPQRVMQTGEMRDKYSRPGERKLRDAQALMEAAARLPANPTRDAKMLEAITMAAEGQAERSAYIQRQPVNEIYLAGFDPASEMLGCCDPPVA